MENQADTQDIILFLERAKRLLSEGKYDFVPRRKNMQALAQHGLTIADARFLDWLLEIIIRDLSRI